MNFMNHRASTFMYFFDSWIADHYGIRAVSITQGDLHRVLDRHDLVNASFGRFIVLHILSAYESL